MPLPILVNAQYICDKLGGCSRRTLHRRADPKVTKKEHLLPNAYIQKKGSPSLWLESEIEAWLEKEHERTKAEQSKKEGESDGIEE